jgi:hypothetical protein
MHKPCIPKHSYCDLAAEFVVHPSCEDLVQHIINCVVQKVVPREFKEEVLTAVAYSHHRPTDKGSVLTSIVETMLRSIILCFNISPDGSNPVLSGTDPKCSSTGLCRTVLVLELEASVRGVLTSDDPKFGSGSEKGSIVESEAVLAVGITGFPWSEGTLDNGLDTVWSSDGKSSSSPCSSSTLTPSSEMMELPVEAEDTGSSLESRAVSESTDWSIIASLLTFGSITLASCSSASRPPIKRPCSS